MKNIFKFAVVGAGAAGLSCIHALNQTFNNKILVIDKNIHTQKNHYFGYWNMPWMGEVNRHAVKQWNSWLIIDETNQIKHTSERHQYTAIDLFQWRNQCLKEKNLIHIEQSFVSNIENHKNHFELELDNKAVYFTENIIDSRTIKIKDKILQQHFLGQVIQSDKKIFNEKEIILMDFRVDQSRGIHFIYLLPFTKTKALIESTMFSFQIENDNWYRDNIKLYLEKYYLLNKWNIISEEKGIIPMSIFKKPKNDFTNIGVQSGAIKPSSGYAFSFIQKQIQYLKKYNFSNHISFNPHKKIDQWMDLIFLKVLETKPSLSKVIFIKIAKSLNGREFALFMSGQANILIRIKVILKMPKKPFLIAFFRYLIKK